MDSSLPVLHVLIVKEKAANSDTPLWIAQALEYDFTVQGEDPKELEIMLYQHILDQMYISNKVGVSISRGRAPDYYWNIYMDATKIESHFDEFNIKKHTNCGTNSLPGYFDFRMAA